MTGRRANRGRRGSVGRASGAGASGAWVIIAALLAAPALGLGAWAAAASIPDPTLTGRETPPVVVDVSTAERRASTSVSISVAHAEPLRVLSPTAGVVTSAPASGTTLHAGDIVLQVNDRPVRAMVADAPLWRSLSQGARGEDVQRLEEFLAATGHLSREPGDRFDATTRAAVTAFARDLGLPRTTVTFDPTWVAWIGPEPLQVEAVLVEVGDTIAPGTPLLSGPVRAASVTVQEPGGGLPAEFGEIAELEVQGVVVPYTVRSGSITNPDDVAAIVAALGPTTEALASLRATGAVEVLVVPASAIITGADGAVCVYPDEHSAPVRVTPVGGGAASIQIPAEFALTTVLANPGRVAGLVPCG